MSLPIEGGCREGRLRIRNGVVLHDDVGAVRERAGVRGTVVSLIVPDVGAGIRQRKGLRWRFAVMPGGQWRVSSACKVTEGLLQAKAGCRLGQGWEPLR